MGTFNGVIDFLVTNWYIPVFFILLLLILSLRYIVNKKAKTTIEILLWKAEEYTFETMDAKLSTISEVGYNFLPAYIRLVLSKKAFDFLIQKSYGEVKLLVHQFDGHVQLKENSPSMSYTEESNKK